MSKRLTLILTLAFVVGIACAAYAEVQNVKVSGDLNIMGIQRNNLTLNDNAASAGTTPVDYSESIGTILSQVRVKIDADLTDNVATTVRLLNERVWGEEKNSTTVNDTEIALDLAYVTLKEFLYSPLTLTLGRQELRFGNAFIIGDPDTNGISAGHGLAAVTRGTILPKSLDDLSSRKAFDAIRATLNYDPLVVDLIYSKIDENNVETSDDVNLYGANANYAVNKNLNTEVYYFERTRDTLKAGLTATTQIDEPEHTRVAGVRGVYTGIENLMLGLEGAYQFGNHVSSTLLYPDDTNTKRKRSTKIQAFALQAIANYVMPKMKYAPSLAASYTYLSGDKYLSEDDHYKGWNPMFEDQAGGTLFNKILGYSNAQLFNLNGSLKPMEDLKASLDYYYLRLNNPYTSAQPATGVYLSGVSGDPTYIMKPNKKSLGQEVDLKLTYDYTEDVQFMLNTGAFMPGDAFDSQNKKTATQVIGSMKVTF